MDAVLGVKIVHNCCQKGIPVWTWHKQSSNVGFCGLNYKEDVICFFLGNSPASEF